MSTQVQLTKQVINVTLEFRNAEGQVVAAPVNNGSNYLWSLGKTGGDAVASITANEAGCKLTPVKLGTDTLTLTVNLDEDGTESVTGTLEVEVVADEEEGPAPGAGKAAVVKLVAEVVPAPGP